MLNLLAYILTTSMLFSSALGFAYRDNTVKFLLRAPQVEGYTANYVVQSHFITNGQDPDNHIRDGVTGNGGYHVFNPEASFTYSIGRKGSSNTAGWWIANAGQSTFGHGPGSLNFALGGTLSFALALNGAPSPDSFTLKNIYIGQGSAGTSNNWWFGGKSCVNPSSNIVVCEATDSRGSGWSFTFQRGGNDVNLVELLNVSRR